MARSNSTATTLEVLRLFPQSAHGDAAGDAILAIYAIDSDKENPGTPTFKIDDIGHIDQTLTNTAAAGDQGIYAAISQSSTALTGTLRGGYFVATNGTGAATGTIRGVEAKARAYSDTTGGGGNVAMLEGILVSADAKAETATGLRGIHIQLDGAAGSSNTLTEGLLINNNSSGTQTTAYAISINEGHVSGHKAFTADILLQNGATIDEATDGVMNLTATTIRATGAFDVTGNSTLASVDVGGGFTTSSGSGLTVAATGALSTNGAIVTESTVTSGKASAIAGSFTAHGSTSGSIVIAPIAAGTNATTIQNSSGGSAKVITMPTATCTLPGLGLTNSWSAVNTFTAAPVVTLDDTTDGVVDALTLTHSSSDNNATAADGVGISFDLENATGTSTVEEWASIDVLSTTITNGSEDGDIVLKVMAAGAVTEAVRIDSSDESLTIGANATNADGFNGLRIFPQTASRGSLLVQSTANTGDSVTTITNAAQGGAYTYTVPDAGASTSFVMGAGDATIAGNKTFSAALLTGAGVGAKNGASVAAAEYGDGVVHKTVLTLTATPLTITQGAGDAGWGTVKLYDYPQGIIKQLAAFANLEFTAGANIAATGSGDFGIGSTATNDITIDGTDVDMINSTGITDPMVASVGSGQGYLATDVAWDGHTSASTVNLNLIYDAGDVTAASTSATATGTVTIYWINAGDY